MYLLNSDDETGAVALSKCGGRGGKREVALDVKREGVEGEERTEEGREKFDRGSEEREEEEGVKLDNSSGDSCLVLIWV